MRKLMRTFDVIKKKFKKESKDVHIDLPGPLSNLTITGKVNQGEITITRSVANKRRFATYILGRTWRDSSIPALTPLLNLSRHRSLKSPE
jgi:hypothetical protein